MDIPLKKIKKRKMEVYIRMPLLGRSSKVIVDWSGHGDIHVEIQDVSKPESFINEAERLMALVDSDPKLKAHAVAGRVILVFPGFSTLAVIIAAYWHGRFGYFPKTKWYIRDSKTGQFSLSTKTIDLQEIRNQARRGRGG